MKKTTLKERVRKRLLQFGRKNKICGILVLPALAVSMFFFHAMAYFAGNGKRFSMLTMIFCLFVVYSSFSFPMFIAGNERTVEWDLSDVDSSVELAPESELSPVDMELLADEDALEDYDPWNEENYHGMEGVDTYDFSELLASLEGRGSKKEWTTQEILEAYESGKLVFDADDWRLVLINKQNSIPDDYSFTLGTIVGNLQCDERILDDLSDMLQAAKNEGLTLIVRSPYRTPKRQKDNFNARVNKYMNSGMSYMEAYQLASRVITLPGNSEHEIGLALDITCDTFSDLEQDFGDTDAGKWLAENSYRYGFIVRYPKGKEYVTGIDYEPWHFRYVGVEAATVITRQGITLEEFWEDLESN